MLGMSLGGDLFNISIESGLRALDLTGVFLNGIIGGRLARKKRFDAVGFVVLACMSAMGGGIIRDLMLQAGAPFAITDPYYLYTALAGAMVALMFRMDSKWSNRFVSIADGFVLGVWAATGVIKTMNLGFGPMPAILMGMLTAIGGGMIRDIASGSVPMVFGGNYLYATPAAVASLSTLAFWYAGEQRLGMLSAMVISFAMTMLAQWRKWTLPAAEDWTITVTASQLRRMMRRQKRETIEAAVAAATEAATEAVENATEHDDDTSAETERQTAAAVTAAATAAVETTANGGTEAAPSADGGGR